VLPKIVLYHSLPVIELLSVLKKTSGGCSPAILWCCLENASIYLPCIFRCMSVRSKREHAKALV